MMQADTRSRLSGTNTTSKRETILTNTETNPDSQANSQDRTILGELLVAI